MERMINCICINSSFNLLKLKILRASQAEIVHALNPSTREEEADCL